MTVRVPTRPADGGPTERAGVAPPAAQASSHPEHPTERPTERPSPLGRPKGEFRRAKFDGAPLSVLGRDLRVAARQRTAWLLPLAFFVAALSLFPLGLGAEPALLRRVAPGVVWVCALLSMMLSVTQLFNSDGADGSLEQMLISPGSLVVRVAERVFAQWLLSGAPLVAVAPLAGLAFGLPGDAVGVLVVSLLLGTPVMALLGALGAALALGLRNGAALVFLLVLPLAMPALIFGCGAVVAATNGEPVGAALSLLGALLIVTTLIGPPATAAALRISMD
jgi:heme exporter protein B